MNSIHNNGENDKFQNDKSLNEDLDKLGHVYRQLEQDEPPELLDQAILNSAHRAVEKKPHWMKFGWLHGLTTAAVFVLAFSIILNQREPVPGDGNGIRGIESVRLQREKTAKKQSVGQSDQAMNEFRMEKSAKGEDQQDMLQSMPTAAAPESVDKDAPARELMLEEALVDEADLMANTPQEGAIAESEAGEMKARARTDSEIEQKILDIIKLKQSGDETWKAELESFKERYPDYPLPDELRN